MGFLDAARKATDIVREVYAVVTDRRAEDQRLTPFHLPESYLQIRENELDPIWGWTVERMQSNLISHAQGDVAAGQELKMAMMRDPIIAGDVETRAETLVQLAQWWERPAELPQWAFDLWVEHWAKCLSSSDREEIAENRLMLGVTPTNPTWAPDRTGRLWLPTLHTKEPGNLSYHSDEGRYHFQSIDKDWPVHNDGQRFLLFQRKTKRPHLSGLILPLGVVWITEAEALRGWSSRNRSHGKPQRLLEVPADQRESEDVKKLVAQAQALLAGGVLIMPKYRDDLPDFDFKLISDSGDVSASFENLIRLCWAYKHLLILGTTEIVSGESASDAKAKTQERIFLRKVKRDAKSDLDGFSELARCFCRVNRLPERWAPIPVIEAEVPEDENQLAERQQKRGQAGQQLGGFLGALDTHNQNRAAANLPLIEFEADYLAEQVGLFLKRKQGTEDRKATH